MGEGLGSGEELFGGLQEEALDTTMMRPIVLLLITITIPHRAFACETSKSSPLGPDDYSLTIVMSEQKRTHLVHVPRKNVPKTPTSMVLAQRKAATDGSVMVWFSGLNTKLEEAGFNVVCPNGTGVGPFRTRFSCQARQRCQLVIAVCLTT